MWNLDQQKKTDLGTNIVHWCCQLMDRGTPWGEEACGWGISESKENLCAIPSLFNGVAVIAPSFCGLLTG